MTGSQPNPYGSASQDPQNPQTQSFGEYQASVAEKPKKKKRGFLKWGVGAVAAIVLFNAFTGNDDDDSAITADSVDNDSLIVEAEADADTETDTGAEFANLEEADADTAAVPADDGVSTEFKNALRSAERYLDFSSFSYQGLYDQLTSEYADAYPAEAAQYALDNVTVDWNQEALESAENYLEFSHFSYQGLYDQLTSEYGEEFTAEQAQYAVDTVDADWNAEAIEAAESYQELMPMSGTELLNQLTSEYGEKFTQEQAQQAVTAVGL